MQKDPLLTGSFRISSETPVRVVYPGFYEALQLLPFPGFTK